MIRSEPSHGQRQLWFLAQADPRSTAYNVLLGRSLRGVLDVASLDAALCAVLRRHTALRSNFSTDHLGEVSVRTSPSPTAFGLEVVPATGQDEAERLARDLLGEPFDLATDQLVRARVVRLGPAEHLLLVVLHHIVADGLSTRIIARELAAAYSAHRRGEPLGLPEPSAQFADHTAWQNAALAARPEALAHWAEVLRDAPHLVTLPTDRRRTGRTPGRSLPFTIPAATADRVRELAKITRSTVFAVLLSAMNVLVGRWSLADDVVVGVSGSGRFTDRFDTAVGHFVNLLAVRIGLDGDLTVTELLRQTRDRVLDAVGHGHVPFPLVVREVGVVRDPLCHPLLQMTFDLWQDVPGQTGAERWDGVDATEWTAALDSAARFDLAVDLRESGDGAMTGEVTYNTDLYDEATIRSFLTDYATTVDVLADQRDSRLSGLRWPGASAVVDRTGRTGVPDLIARHAAARPEDVALSGSDGVLTYRALDAAAEDRARAMAAQGARRGSVVAVDTAPGHHAVVSRLAAWKLGASWVVAHPCQPDAISTAVSDGRTHPPAEGPATGLDDIACHVVSADGTPHRLTHADLLGVVAAEPGPATWVVPPGTFTTEFGVWSALVAGHTVVSIDQGGAWSAASAERLYLHQGLLEHVAGPGPGECVVVVGEPVADSVVRKAAEVWPDTGFRVEERTPGGIPVSALHVLDRMGTPVPVGAVGELCLFLRFGVHRTGTFGRRDHSRLRYLGSSPGTPATGTPRLAEVEDALLAVDGIERAVVVGDAELIAYAVLSGPVTLAAVRSRLRGRVPAHHVPTHLVEVERVPCTPDGRVRLADRSQDDGELMGRLHG